MGNDVEKAKIIVVCEGHEYYYPISDILRLFTGTIPRQDGNTIVCDAGRILPDGEVIEIRSRVTEGKVETNVASGSSRSRRIGI